MFVRVKKPIVVALMVLVGAFSVCAQVVKPKPEAVKPVPTPDPKAVSKVPTTAEQVVETALFIYGLGGGRERLQQIRKSTLERGRSTYTAADGKAQEGTYQRFVIRGDKLAKERIRLDQEFPTVRYSLIFSDEKIFGMYNNSVFTPREDASKSFENQIIHGIEAALRYKENGSTIVMGPNEKFMGVDYYTVDLTDKAAHKTRYYVSVKSFRIMMLTYEEGGVKYRRKFYDYNYAQGTLVPFRSVLWADGKIVEETEIGTITYGQKVDEELFKAG